MTKEEKLEGLKKFLDENEIEYLENYTSGYGMVLDLKIPKYMIAVHIDNGDTDAFYYRMRPRYRPFMIREEETMEFILEKMQNCIVDIITKKQKVLDNIKRKEERRRMHEERVKRDQEAAAERKRLKAERMQRKKAKAHPKKKEPQQVVDPPVKRKRQRIVKYEKLERN